MSRVFSMQVKDDVNWLIDLGSIVEIRDMPQLSSRGEWQIAILFRGMERQHIRDFTSEEDRDHFIERWKRFTESKTQ